MILITGSTGLIGFAASNFYLKKNNKVIGVDNDLRSYFFGKKSSNKWKEKILKKNNNYSCSQHLLLYFLFLKEVLKDENR